MNCSGGIEYFNFCHILLEEDSLLSLTIKNKERNKVGFDLFEFIVILV